MFKENGEMYYEGKTANDNGFICKVRDIKSGGSSEDWSEEWSHIRWTDEQICDKTKNCENGLDEQEEICQQQVVVVIGSDGMDGVYNGTRILNASSIVDSIHAL